MGAKPEEVQLKIADTSATDVVLDRLPANRRRWLWIGGGFVMLLLLLMVVAPRLSRWSQAGASIPFERLRVATVMQGDLVRDFSVQGRVVAAVSPTLYAPAAGTISLTVDAGAQVTNGQVLARIVSPDLSAQLAQEDANLERVVVELKRRQIETRQKLLDDQKVVDLAQVALEAADRENRRAKKAFAIKAISQIDFEKASDEMRNATLAQRHALADAALDKERLAFEDQTRQLQVDRQRLLVDDLKRQVDALAIRSPITGMVGNVLIDQKAAVARDQALLSVVDLSAFEIEALVPESYADDLGLGMAAEVRLPGGIQTGTVIAVSPEIVANQVTVRVGFDDATPAGLRQNQRLTTRILMEVHRDVLTLQRGQFLDSGGGRLAYVLGADDIARRRSIQLGARSLAKVEVLSGLKAGDRVIISSIDGFRGAEAVYVSR